MRPHRISPAGGVLLWWCLFAAGAFAQPSQASPDLEVFVRDGCSHCVAAKTFLIGVQRERPSLTILYRDVGADPSALVRLQQLAADRGVAQVGVPAFHLRGRLLVGYRDEQSTGAELIALLDSRLAPGAGDVSDACRVRSGSDCMPSAPSEPEITLPWFGRLAPRDVGLPLFTLAIGLLDGFNPCAMWVLLFLLSLLATLQNRFKMALVAGTFVLVSGFVYFAFMAAWLNMFLLVGLSRAVQVGLGAVALFVGAVNVKDFVAFRRGLSLAIPDSAKPGLYARMRNIVQADNLIGALIGIVVLAILVNVIELLCTAGFPALYTQVLTMHHLPLWQYYGYLLVYNVAYMFDDAVMATLAVLTLGHRKLAEREGRWLKLISGTVMIGLGLVLIIKPDLLSGA